jgi:hypothetical protein
MVKHKAFLLKVKGRLYVLPFNFYEEGYMFYHLTFRRKAICFTIKPLGGRLYVLPFNF